ncbi:MAG TPA: tetratricopeptide repeat protein [Planctomycetota bacterium]|nr:tetratricopeptide repeat protein [Planctomycetota bacterium]
MRAPLFLALALASSIAFAGQPTIEPPPKAPPGFFQALTPCCIVETDISPEFTKKVAGMVSAAEQKFYNLFKLNHELMQGVSKVKFDNKANISGTILHEMGFRQWVEVRVFKSMETFSDEWFDSMGVKDKQQRMRQGIPGAYFSISKPYEEKRWLRRIRTFVSNRDDDELERTILHEMGHLFMLTYLLEFSGDPPAGQESMKRGTPSWLQEGMAQLFENLWSKAESAKKARTRQQAMIYEAIKIGDSYPFDEFINITNAHNLKAVAGDPLRATLNYAQSASVMDYMVNIDGTRFFNFLQNLRELHFKRNLQSRDQNHVPELYSFQNEAFKNAFNADLKQVEDYWKKHVIKTMDETLKKTPEYHYWIGEYYLRRGKNKEQDYAKAEEMFNKAMQLAPNRGEGYLGTGRMAIRKGNNDLALATLQKAAELMPKDEDAQYYYGVSQLNMGQFKEAVESFEKSLKIWPRNDRALAGMGQAAFHSRQYDKAMEAFEKAYEASRNPYHMFQKGNAAFFGKKYRDAQTSFARYCEMFPNDAQGQLWYGLSAWRLGEKDFAKEKMKAALKLQPNDGLAKEALALAEKGETVKFQREDPEVEAGKKPPEKPNIRIEDE